MRLFFQMLLALLTLAVMIWATWQGYLLLRQEQLGLEPAMRSPVIIFAILLIICTFMITQAIGTHGDKLFRSRQSAQRLALYERCLSAQVMDPEDPAGGVDVAVETDVMAGQLALLASAKVMKALEEARSAAAEEGPRSPAAKAAMQRLVIAMREDLGTPVDYLSRKEIQQLFK
ncbi:hypothetical protein ACWKWU_22320 [Chitinophaga lutea]